MKKWMTVFFLDITPPEKVPFRESVMFVGMNIDILFSLLSNTL